MAFCKAALARIARAGGEREAFLRETTAAARRALWRARVRLTSGCTAAMGARMWATAAVSRASRAGDLSQRSYLRRSPALLQHTGSLARALARLVCPGELAAALPRPDGRTTQTGPSLQPCAAVLIHRRAWLGNATCLPKMSLCFARWARAGRSLSRFRARLAWWGQAGAAMSLSGTWKFACSSGPILYYLNCRLRLP